MRLIETEIRELKLKLLDMAELVRVQLEQCLVAMQTQNTELSEKVIQREKVIDKFDNKILRRCERIIALYQPVANDLRFVFSVLKINAFLELIGDNIHAIATRNLKITMPTGHILKTELKIEELQHLTKGILYDSLRAYFRENAEEAKQIFMRDDKIDAIHDAAFDIIITHIKKDPDSAANCILLLQIVKSLEKIGDLSVAIAEEGLFHTEGILYRHTKLKYRHQDLTEEEDAED